MTRGSTRAAAYVRDAGGPFGIRAGQDDATGTARLRRDTLVPTCSARGGDGGSFQGAEDDQVYATGTARILGSAREVVTISNASPSGNARAGQVTELDNASARPAAAHRPLQLPRAHYVQACIDLCTKHNEGHRAHRFLDKHRGNERKLWMKLLERYNDYGSDSADDDLPEESLALT